MDTSINDFPFSGNELRVRNDKGRYRQDSVTKAPKTFQELFARDRNSKSITHGILKVLFAADVPFRCLHGVAKQKLNLLRFSSTTIAGVRKCDEGHEVPNWLCQLDWRFASPHANKHWLSRRLLVETFSLTPDLNERVSASPHSNVLPDGSKSRCATDLYTDALTELIMAARRTAENMLRTADGALQLRKTGLEFHPRQRT